MEGESKFRHWDELIPDALELIFKTLPLQQILQVIPLVCKSWFQVVEGPYCWKKIDIEEWSMSMKNQSKPERIDRMLQTLITRSSGSLVDLRVSLLDDHMLSFIAENAGSLQTLIMHWSSVSDSCVAQLAKNFSSLTTLDVSYCTKISTEAFEAIGRSCRRLEVLTWRMLPTEVTDLKRILNDPTVSKEVFTISRTMPKLKHLSLAYITISDSVVLDILSGCPKLEFLDSGFCRGVDALDVKLLCEKYPKVKVLDPNSVDFSGLFSDSESDNDWGYNEYGEYYDEYYADDYEYYTDDYDGAPYDGFC